MEQGGHDGWETTCWDGIEQTIDLIAEKRIKIIVNGGALNPDGLARKIQELVCLISRANYNTILIMLVIH